MMIETQMASSGDLTWSRRCQETPIHHLHHHHVHHQAHVLAVDDSLVDRKVIETLLRVSSCKVTAVDSARRALQFLGLLDENEEEEEKRSGGDDDDAADSKVDMIVTDYSMPGMTGYELLKKIKESSAFREVPVVIMSSEDINTRIDRCMEEGAEDYIVKPVKLSDVRRIKDYMREDRSEAGKENRINKRKKSSEGSDASPPDSTLSPSSSSSDSSTVVPVESQCSLEPHASVQSQPDSLTLEPDTSSENCSPVSPPPRSVPNSHSALETQDSSPPIEQK